MRDFPFLAYILSLVYTKEVSFSLTLVSLFLSRLPDEDGRGEDGAEDANDSETEWHDCPGIRPGDDLSGELYAAALGLVRRPAGLATPARVVEHVRIVPTCHAAPAARFL